MVLASDSSESSAHLLKEQGARIHALEQLKAHKEEELRQLRSDNEKLLATVSEHTAQ